MNSLFVIYNRLIGLVAYGPWGPLHKLFIFLFRHLYRISERPSKEHKRLGDFFLRDKNIRAISASLCSPVDAKCLDGPTKMKEAVSVKGIKYRWQDLPEWSEHFREGVFWNFYLAPKHYHWFHAAASGTDLEAIRIPGTSYPVNALGRWIRSDLYYSNERLSFRWNHPEHGKILMLCVGALGVSRIHCDLGHVPVNEWTSLRKEILIGDRLGAFELGSSVLLLAERLGDSQPVPPEVEVGTKLC